MAELIRRTERMRAYAGPLLLLLALALLHLALLQGPLTPAGKALLLGHVGLVLLWQPLVSGARQVSAAGLLVFLLLLLAAALFLSWGLMLLWGLLLTGMVGGKVFCYPSARDRAAYWLVVVYLVVLLVGVVTPQLLDGIAQVPAMLPVFAHWLAVPTLALVLLLGLPKASGEEAVTLDVVGTLLIVLVLAGVLLGALAFMFVARSDYVWALLQALGAVAGALLLLALVWSPREGFAGLGLAISRRVLSGAQPFAPWLGAVADLAQREESADALVAAALTRLLDWPGLCGVFWRSDETGELSEVQRIGRPSRHATQLRHGALEVTVFSLRPLAPTPAWHVDLMLRMLAEFHMAKLQAQRLQALSFLRAVHETGARTTHEIKNLLQSLDALCFALQEDGGRNPAGLQALLQGQLPALRQRLEEAMQRIRRPRDEDLRPGRALDWWQQVQTRHAGGRIRFEAGVGSEELEGLELPLALFDCVADNLLGNALEKPAAAAICVRLERTGEGCRLSVEDSGEAIESGRASALLLQPLASDTGLGIGLYQAGRLAESAGYRLRLEENRAGCVRFVLQPVMPAQA